jgi:hypothetical protein
MLKVSWLDRAVTLHTVSCPCTQVESCLLVVCVCVCVCGGGVCPRAGVGGGVALGSPRLFFCFPRATNLGVFHCRAWLLLSGPNWRRTNYAAILWLRYAVSWYTIDLPFVLLLVSFPLQAFHPELMHFSRTTVLHAPPPPPGLVSSLWLSVVFGEVF